MAAGTGVIFRRAVVTSVVASGANWILDSLGRYTLVSNAIGPITFSIELLVDAFILLLPTATTIITSHTPGDLPSGFEITGISQGTENMPGANIAFPPSTTPIFPVIDAGSYAIAWNCGGLNINSVTQNAFNPVTMTMPYLSPWTFTVTGVDSAIGIGQLITNLNTRYEWYAADSVTPIINPFSPTLPIYPFTGNYSYNTNACSLIGPLTNVTIVNPVTGEFSWTLPPGTGGVVITLSQIGHADIVTSVLSPTLNYIPSNIYGAVTVTIKPITTFPICYGPASTLTLAITVPFIPPAGIGAGINLGGTPTLQFIGNPSGIYTLVPGKTNDTLYERIPAATTQNVKIPDPLIKTAFLGD